MSPFFQPFFLGHWLFRASLAALLTLAALLPCALRADELTNWPGQYTMRPWEAARLTAADVVGPDGIVYPDFTGVGVTGGIPDINNSTIRAGYTVFNVTTYGANGSDTISDNLYVAAAAAAVRTFLNANPANKAILYFPTGTYYLSAPILFTQGNVVIDGDGPTSTFIKLQTEVGQTGTLFTIKRDPAFAGYLTSTTFVPRGGNTLTLNADPASSGFSVGNWVRLAPTVSGAGTTISDRYNNPDNHVIFTDPYWHTGRVLFAKVTAVNSGAKTVTLDRTFTHDYFVNESPQLRRVSMAENCGIQDLSIETLADTATIDTILFEYTANSWIKNIKTVKAKSWPFTINSSARFDVRDSQFLGTWIYLQQGGGVAYLGWTSFTTDALMENCQASDLRHMAIFQASNRSVIRNCTFTGKSVQSPQLHGRFPHENLIEGTTFNTSAPDGSASTRGITAYGSDHANSLVHGANGPRNVFYNNSVLSGMGTSVFGGTSEGFIFAYNRILKTEDTEAKPAIMAMDRSFDFVVRGNIFQAIGTLPAITLAEGTCTGWNITDNKFYGTNGYLYEGDSAPAITSNNRFFSTATTPAAATTPEVASIYAWQKTNAATARLVIAGDRRLVTDTGGTTDLTVVRVKASTAAAITVTLSATPAGLSVPATVTIPIGETAATFTVTGTNVSGEQSVTLTASASGLLPDSETITVLDQDLAQPNFGNEKWPVPPVGLPSGWKAGNYGQVSVAGTQSYTVGTDTWAITGGGLRTENFHGSLARSGRRFVYRTLDGDGEIRTRITAASGEQQVGLMIADDEATLTDFIWVEPNGRVYSSSNDAQNGMGNGVPTERVVAGTKIVPSWLRLKRVGSVFTAYRSTVANPATEGDWTVLATVDLYLNPNTDYKSPAILDQRMHFGFFINSNSATVAASASFSGTQFTGALVGTSPPPATPTGLTATLVGNTQTNLAWTDNANDETACQIDVRVGSATTWSPLVTVAADATTYSHTGLLDGVTYAYRVRALRNTDNAASANTASSSVTTTLTSLPLAPANPAALGLFTNQIQFTWSDLAHNETGYQIERSTAAASGFTLLTTLGAGAVGYIDSNLPDGTRYYYRARAVNSLGNSPYTTAVAGITPLTAPDEFYITSTSPTAIIMEWTDNTANETEYAVERSTSSGTGFAQIGTTSASTFTDATVVNGTRYYYRIRAINAVAQSDYAAEVTALASAYQPAEFFEPFSQSLSPTSLVGRPGSGNGVSGNYSKDPFYPTGGALASGNIEAGRIPGLGNKLTYEGGLRATLSSTVQSIINPPANGNRTFWISFNYRTGSSVAANNSIRLSLADSAGTPKISISANTFGAGMYSLAGTAFSYDSPQNSLSANTSYIFLLKVTLTDTNGNSADGAEQSEQRLWLYPSSTLPPLAEPVIGGLNIPNGSLGSSVLFNQIHLVGAPSQSIDEVRIASTYSQAALPPPPVAVTPGITAAQSATGLLGNAFTYDLLTSNTPTSYALASGSLPPGVTLNTATGRLSGTPTTAGTYTPGFTASNSAGTSPAVTATITIINPSAAALLSGSVIGTAGSYGGGTATVDKVFDGNLTTYFDAPTANGNWAGLDFGAGNEKTITEVRYAPRSSGIFPDRMIGAIIQGSSSADFTTGLVNLYTISTAPASGVLTAQPISNATPFRYVRILTPSGSYGNVAELQFYGLSTIPAVTAGQSAPGTIGNAFTYDILASNSPASYALASGSLPPGVTLNTSTGRLSGTPTAAGAYTPGFTATNATGTSPAVTVTLTITDGQIIVQEPFAYTLATTNPLADSGLNSNNGLPATNIGGSPSGTSTGLRGPYGTDQTVVAGLAYSDANGVLTTSGNALQRNTGTGFSASSAAIYRFMATDPFASLRSTASSNYLGWNGTAPTTLYFSVLLSVSALNTGTDNRLVINLGTDNSSWNVYLGQFTGTSQWRYGDQAGTSALLGTANVNQPVLIVGRLIFTSSTQFITDYWFNPPLGQSLGTPTYTKTYTTTTSGGQFRALQTRDGANTLTIDEFRLGTTYAAVTPYTAPPTALANFRTNYGLASNGTQDTATTAGDGIANLLKFAFNMLGSGTGQAATLATPNASVLAPSGSAGLPSASLGSGGDTGKLQLTFIRRKASASPAPGITYSVEFSNDLASWAVNPSATESVTSIDATFERVAVTDSAAVSAKRFARVKVSTP